MPTAGSQKQAKRTHVQQRQTQSPKMAMVKAALLFAVVCSSAIVHGTVVSEEEYNLQILNVSRVMWEENGEMQMTLTIEFTANRQPRVQWMLSVDEGEIVVPESAQTFHYEDGRGIVSATCMAVSFLTVTVGHYSHYLVTLALQWDLEDHSHNNISQTLNTIPAHVSPDFDIAYSPDESFSAAVTAPKHQADGFTWMHFFADYYALDAKGYWFYPDTQSYSAPTVSRSWQMMGRFLRVVETVGNDSAVFQLDFNMAAQRADGLVEVEIFSVLDDRNAERFVTEIIEKTVLSVHEISMDGPFPPTFTRLTTRHDLFGAPTFCTANDRRDCMVSCQGVANEIASFTIYKVGDDGAGRHISRMWSRYENGHVVEFHALLNETSNFAGTYACQVTSRDGTTGEITFDVGEDYPRGFGG